MIAGVLIGGGHRPAPISPRADGASNFERGFTLLLKCSHRVFKTSLNVFDRGGC
jgi:hypothetical protein